MGEISPKDYQKVIRSLFKFFDGGKNVAKHFLEREMQAAIKSENYESAAHLRDRIKNLDRIKDFHVIRDTVNNISPDVNAFGRIEGYDISNTLGEHAFGSMVVFEDGSAKKSAYRLFGIKTLSTPNDVAMLREVLERRFARYQSAPQAWPLPDMILIDGGLPQFNVAKAVLEQFNLKIPLVGMAKGPDRDKDELVYDKADFEIARLAHALRPLLRQVRDEAHRFAIGAHRRKRGKKFLE